MRLPNTSHTSRPWRIHELTPDFRLEDVWELPGVGGPDDFPRLVALIASLDPSQGSSRAARMLWATRWKIGALLGWDDPSTGLGSRVPTLRDRLPADLRDVRVHASHELVVVVAVRIAPPARPGRGPDRHDRRRRRRVAVWRGALE